MTIKKFNIPIELSYYFEGVFLKSLLKELGLFDKQSKYKMTINNKFVKKNKNIFSIDTINYKNISKFTDLEPLKIKKAILTSKLKASLYKKKKIIKTYKLLGGKKTILLLGPIEKTINFKSEGYLIIHSYYFDSVKMAKNTRHLNLDNENKVIVGTLLETKGKVDYIISYYDLSDEIIKEYNILKNNKVRKKDIDKYLSK